MGLVNDAGKAASLCRTSGSRPNASVVLKLSHQAAS
mgnify:CR=1 FL=1